ncbi:hypothetical protein [Blautia sp. An249]|uniref:hypothetical protein n=1 Tax=Blautia sp. An249 TaxID=1965603 RepID=UPI00111FB817|nr:hypothetical protein [Blautia sp. An249]
MHGNFKDITGQKFNMLTALEFVEMESKIGAIWKFKCDCGNIVDLPACRVATKNGTKSCGCLNKKNKPKIDLTGQKYGRLTVLKCEGTIGRRRMMWLCQCDCGKQVIVQGTHLRSGHTKSCGCLNAEKISSVNYKTGLCRTKLYYTYCNMCNRCNRENNSEYSDYGGRGITVCNEWIGVDGFLNFSNWALSNGYYDGLTLDRIDNDKGYSPDNCRWVDKFVQANNKRNNHFIKVNGEVGTVANIARKYNVDYWNLLHYSKGGQNCKYPDLRIEVADESEIQEYRKGQINRAKERENTSFCQSETR